MVNKIQLYRSPTHGNRPTVGSEPYGMPYVNFADKQLGVVDSTQTPQDLIGVPYFSAAANYNAGQPVNYQGQQYVALTSVVAGPWNSAQWSPVASQSWVSSQGGLAGGYVNKARNNQFALWQRGTSFNISNTGLFVADGWAYYIAGGSGVAQLASGRYSKNGLSVSGSAGSTSNYFRHNIEALDSWLLGGNVTFQINIFNNTGNLFVPQLQIGHPTAIDNFGSIAIDLNPANMQACPNGVWTKVAYTFAFPVASAHLGLQIILNPGTITSGSVIISDADIRATPGIPIGINNNPPPVEYKPFSVDYILCCRYYVNNNPTMPEYDGYSSVAGQGFLRLITQFPAPMHHTPVGSYSLSSYYNLQSTSLYVVPTFAALDVVTADVGLWYCSTTNPWFSAEI